MACLQLAKISVFLVVLLLSKAKADESNFRLPNNTVPILYDVEINTKIHLEDLNFQGKVVITIKVNEKGTKNVVVHARQLKSFAASISDAATGTTIKLITAYAPDTEFLTLTPENSLELVKGKIYKVAIEYKGELRKDNGGFYVSSYTNESGKFVNIATTQFAPTDARHAFPCYDEPAKRASFKITINHDPSLNAISNMPIDPEKTKPGKTVFQKTPNMPTYLVAFIVSEFESTSCTLNGLTQRIFSRKGTETSREFALLTGVQIIERLSEYFDIPYALPKLDQVAIPDFAAGAMENWGLVTYREENLLYNTKKSTTSTQTKAANIIGHEYTHLWFGNLVTIKWWTWLWLKEGFANFFSYKIIDEVYPEWDKMQMFIVSEYQKALQLDGEAKTRPMTHYVAKQNEIRSLYDSIAYSKSGAVLRMWQNSFGDEVFRAGLNKYLTLNQYTGAEEDDLFDAIGKAVKDFNLELKDTVSVMMKSWTNQGGVPLLTVTRNYDNGSFNITQNSFHNDPALHDDKLWYVPVNFATSRKWDYSNTSADFYLKDRSIVLQDNQLFENDWLILNKQSTGYYRINYDERNWKLITHSMIANPVRIHPLNRASILYDAYILSTTSHLKHGTLLSLMIFLHNEDQYAPWVTAENILTTFHMFLSEDVRYPSFKAFVADLVGNIYDRLGIQSSTGEQHFTNNVRNIAINMACMSDVKNCSQDSLQMLKDLAEKGIEIKPNLQSAIYCNGLKNAPDYVFDYMYNRLMASDNQAERKILIAALGCTTESKNLFKFIESSISKSDENSLRAQERITLLNSAYSQSNAGISVCISFLFDNYNEYAALTSSFAGPNPLDSDIKGLSKYVVNSPLDDLLLGLVSIVKTHPDVSSDLEEVVKANLEKNNDWLDNNLEPIMEWLARNYKISGASNAFGTMVPVLIVMCYAIARFF